MNKTLKTVIAGVMLMSGLLFMSGASAALTETQISSILSLLSSFGADATTIANVNASLRGQATTGTTTTTGNPAACAGITFSRTLSLGATGTDVKCLQAILNLSADTQIAASGTGSAGYESTYFGSLTKAAVIKFQNKYASEVLTPVGLTAGTGLVGAKTNAKLNAMLTAGAGTGTGTGTGTVVLPTAAGLTVSLATDTPFAATIVADAGTGGQALIPFTKFVFSTPAGTTAKVTTLKFNRGGISSDSDITNAYLYDGSTKLAEMTSFSTGVITFTNAAGLFTVSGSKTITLKADLYSESAAGKTISLSIAAATNVVSDASAINGTFPMTGNTMTVAVVTDLGRLSVVTTTNSMVVDPGLNGFEAARFTLTAANQKIKISSFKVYQLGSINKTDIANLALYVGSTQLGSTVTALDADGAATFDFSAAPYEIPSGVVRTLSLKVDVIGGSTRTMQFSLQKSADVVAVDTNYNVSVRPDSGVAGTFTTQTSSAVAINAGNLVISRATDSASGNVALNGTNVSVAKFNVKAVGENVKVTSMKVLVASTSVGAYTAIDNVKIYFDGVQVGTTVDHQYNTSTVTLLFTVPVGETKTLEIKADIKGTAGTTAVANGQTLQAKFEALASNAQRMVSLGSFNFPTADQTGNTLTISAAALTAAKNLSIGDITTVYNVNETTLGSFLVTAGAAEGVDISRITISSGAANATTTAAQSLGSAFSNLKLFYGGTQLGATVVPNTSDAAATFYSFYPQNFSLVAGQTVQIDVKGDVLASPTWTNAQDVALQQIEATGKVTSQASNIDGTGAKAGQGITLSSAGVLTLSQDSSTPINAIQPMGAANVTLGVFKLTGNSTEDLNLSKVYVMNDRALAANATSSGLISNLTLWCGTAQFGSAVTGFITPAAGPRYAGFSGNCTITKGSYKLITVKGDIVNYAVGPYSAGATSNAYTSAQDYVKTWLYLPSPITGVSTDAIIARGAGAYASTTAAASSTSNITYPYRTSLSASIACYGSCTGRIRSSSDKIAALTLTSTGDVDTLFRAASQEQDDTVTIAGDTDWTSSSDQTTGTTMFYTSTTKLKATSTTYLDNSSAIWWRIASSAGTGSTTYITLNVGATDLNAYDRLSFFWKPELKGAYGIATATLYLASTSTYNGSHVNAGANATTGMTMYASGTWNEVDVSLTSSTNGMIATTGSAYIGIAIQGAIPQTDITIDAVKLYNDSIVVDIGGYNTSTATGTAFYLKTTGDTIKATGYLGMYNSVRLIPDSEIAVTTAATAYNLVANTNTLLYAQEAGLTRTLSLSMDLGSDSVAGDFRWFDQGTQPKTPITWLNGTSPITASLSY